MVRREQASEGADDLQCVTHHGDNNGIAEERNAIGEVPPLGEPADGRDDSSAQKKQQKKRLPAPLARRIDHAGAAFRFRRVVHDVSSISHYSSATASTLARTT